MNGLSFKQYNWAVNQDFSCVTSATCYLNCKYLGGIYNDGYCYELKALRKLCVKVGLEYTGDKEAADASSVKDVYITTGCFFNGDVAQYETITLSDIE